MKKEINIRYEAFAKADELDTETQRLFYAACEARQKAYAPYSQFLVGCALLLDNGEIITGSNQENAAYPSGLCAERTAIFWTSANFPNSKVLKIFIVGSPENTDEKSVITPPCGACRQSLLEYEVKQNEQISVYFSSVAGEGYRVWSVADLLPFTFDASYL